jgi:hypothetical protein
MSLKPQTAETIKPCASNFFEEEFSKKINWRQSLVGVTLN